VIIAIAPPCAPVFPPRSLGAPDPPPPPLAYPPLAALLLLALGPAPAVPPQGMYGPWSVEDEDRLEVMLYRAGLNGAALSAAGLSTTYLLPGSPVAAALASPAAQDAVALGGAASMGLALWLIHVYVTPLKRFVQALWAAGTGGGAFLMASHGDAGVVDYVGGHPGAVWLVGPLFAAVTGVAVKEGLCYGKGECAALALLTPALLLAHLGGLAPAAVERAGVAGWVALVSPRSPAVARTPPCPAASRPTGGTGRPPRHPTAGPVTAPPSGPSPAGHSVRAAQVDPAHPRRYWGQERV